EYVQVACDRVLVTRNRRIFAFLALIAFSAANRRPPSGQARGQAFSGTCARHRMSMRALLGVFIGLAGIAAVHCAPAFAAAKYMTWVPGTPHTGALPPLTAEEGALAGRLRQHIEAIGSKPHNIDHFDELEKAARYIETMLEAAGYTVNRQPFTADGKTGRNIQAVVPSP